MLRTDVLEMDRLRSLGSSLMRGAFMLTLTYAEGWLLRTHSYLSVVHSHICI